MVVFAGFWIAYRDRVLELLNKTNDNLGERIRLAPTRVSYYCDEIGDALISHFRDSVFLSHGSISADYTYIYITLKTDLKALYRSIAVNDLFLIENIANNQDLLTDRQADINAIFGNNNNTNETAAVNTRQSYQQLATSYDWRNLKEWKILVERLTQILKIYE